MPTDDTLDTLLVQVRATDRATRIEFRDRVVDHGTAAIGPMAGWLNDREFAGFAVRVLERIAGQPEHRDAVVRVLQAARAGAATPTIAGDIRAALDHLAGRLVRPQTLARQSVPFALGSPELARTGSAILLRLAPWQDDDDRELPRHGYGYRAGMAPAELYDSTRAWWYLSPERAQHYRYAVAVNDDLVRGVWEIDHKSWREASRATARRLGRSTSRWGFSGTKAPVDVEEHFFGTRGRQVPETRADGRAVFGSGSVVAYWPR